MAEQKVSAKILVVDDEPSIRELLSVSLKFAGFTVDTAADGQQAVHKSQEFTPDLIVLDVMLPDFDGYEVLRRIRERSSDVPVLFLTAKDDLEDKLHGLTAGADDYVTKPFSLEEVVTRIQVILRRTNPTEPDSAIIRYHDLEINEDTYEVRRAGHLVELSPTEYKLLRYLMVNAERVVSKVQILDHVWDYDWIGEASIVESYISYLRRKIDSAEALGITDPTQASELLPLIHTKRGIGYVMRADR
ncbi:response regulator transcription factor [Arcanobacterium pinnipediorum]|uniref:Response regulator transcription factor n=1 Tax=Arcanobacterium pinnipediorum TaxID=1503041 RepID=A0ABY5AJ92_9ACTO|nr:response regulator transcription factor [Arcanobacterium pinnipediorum]USR79253.1 response regulator transcription factor [Arcanobacterium pinnipediorum]